MANVAAGVPAPVNATASVREPILDALKLAAMAEMMPAVFKPMPRCECCYEYRHVARDGYGGVALVCTRCSYQICATGTCHLHHARLYYPELATEHAARGGVGPVPSPPEVESLFYVPETERPKYDPAELADADAV